MLRNVIILALLGVSFAQQCVRKTQLEAYMNCLKGDLDNDYMGYETEFYDVFKGQCKTCFRDNDNDAQNDGRCAIKPEEYADGYLISANGPITQSCGFCGKIAKGIIDMYLKSDKASKECLRAELGKSLALEITPCIRRKLGKSEAEFDTASIPDFDAASDGHEQTVVNTILLMTFAYFRLDQCRTYDSFFNHGDDRYTNTLGCLDDMSQYTGLTQTCQAIGGCISGVQNSQSCNITDVERATCQCIQEKRTFLKSRVNAIQAAVDSDVAAGKSSSDCAADVMPLLVSEEGVDWGAVAQEAIQKCITGNSLLKNMKMETLLRTGCSWVASKGQAGRRDLSNGIRFIQGFIDAMVGRVRRFCNGPQCSSN